MSSLNELIIAQTNQQLSEDLLERLAIVEHKIKFMDKVPVCFMDTNGQPQLTLGEFASLGGAVLTTAPQEASYVIFTEAGKLMEELMPHVPELLDTEWPAVKFNRICLLSDGYSYGNLEEAVALVETIAEMIHPGHFIFGDEGSKWIKFSI